MADLDDHPDFDLDTALSATLDGDLDAYAAELGVPVAEVQAAVTTPAATARSAELAAARDALGDPPALDDVTRRRLLTGAGVGTGSRSAPSARDRGWMLRAGAAAAVTLVVLAGLFALTRTSDDAGRQSSSSAGGSAAVRAPKGDLGNVGSLDEDQIRGLLRGEEPAASSPEAQKSTAGSAGDTSVPGFSADAGGAAAAADCAAQYSAQGTVRFRASGSYQGQAAIVLGIDSNGRTIVFVVAAADCNRVLYSASR